MAKPKDDKREQDDYDSTWKEAIEQFLPDFLAFFFPEVAADIDWTKGYEFLDKEFQQIVRQGLHGRGTVDKLVKVWKKSGEEGVIYIHIDVQSQYEKDFDKRMFIYHYRIFDRYQKPVVTLVIFGDEGKTWAPDHYGYKLWGCEIKLKYPTVKLRNYRDKTDELEQNPNPFALVVLAHLHTKSTKNKPQQRAELKWRLTKSLYQRGYTKEKILSLYHFIDWMMRLPEDIEKQFMERVTEYEEEQKVPYVTSAERFGIERGRLETSRESIMTVLQARFQNISLPQGLVDMVKSIADLTVLDQLLRYSATADSFPTFEQKLAEVTGTQKAS